MKKIQLFVNMLILVIVGVVPLLVGLDVQGQEIPRDEYLRHLSLKPPEIVRQTNANTELHLFGNAEDPENYEDTDPVDGIDDRRHEVLLDLAVEFAPYLVLNSTMIPMDFRLFMAREEVFLLSVDKWNVSKYPPELVDVETIQWPTLSPPTSEAGSQESCADNEDHRLRCLLEEFDPFKPGEAYRSGAVAPKGAEHQVMFFDFPGDSEETWKQEYENHISKALPQAYEDFVKVFVHPFVESVNSRDPGSGAYEFVLQYWFFYPYNDGFNNHEGDWEHINVFIKPLNKLHAPLSKADVCRILMEGVPADTAPDRLVIQKVDYYFHHKVITLDYTRPNVYQSSGDWETEYENTKKERLAENWIWRQVRYRAYWDDDEKEINTHPIGFIGGDNVGLDQMLRHPGSSNQVSNGTYPFRGFYKNVGQAGFAENIAERFDHRKYFAAGRHKRAVPEKGYRRGSVVSFASPDRIEIIPDGERVVNLVKENAQARRDWAWLVLPIRWGYPAAESPLAGMVAYTDLGNSSVLGPSYNVGWNRSGDIPGFQVYPLHTYRTLLDLTWQDSIINPLGYLNLPVSLVATLPSVKIIWRPINMLWRAGTDGGKRVFQPKGYIPYRLLGIGPVPPLGIRPVPPLYIGPVHFTYMHMSRNFVDLILGLYPMQIRRIGNRLDGVINQGADIVGEASRSVENIHVRYFEIDFYLGERLVIQNLWCHGSSVIGYDLQLSSNEVFEIRGDLNFREYSGSLRYNMMKGSFMLFLKGGYGLSWYRLENISTDGELLPNHNGPWINKPDFKRLSTYLPNTGHFGGGIEWVPFQNIFFGSVAGLDIGIRAEGLFYGHCLGIDFDEVYTTSSGAKIRSNSTASSFILRPVLSLAATFSF